MKKTSTYARKRRHQLCDRFQRIGKWGFNAQQLVAIAHALDAYEAIHDASSPMQMQQALVIVQKSIMRQTGART